MGPHKILPSIGIYWNASGERSCYTFFLNFPHQRLWLTSATLAPVATPLDATVLMKMDLEPNAKVHSQSRPRLCPRRLHLWRAPIEMVPLYHSPKYDSVVWVRTCIRSKTLIVGTCTSK